MPKLCSGFKEIFGSEGRIEEHSCSLFFLKKMTESISVRRIPIDVLHHYEKRNVSYLLRTK